MQNIKFKLNPQSSWLENCALWSVIFTAWALTLTTTLTAIFFPLTIVLYYLSGNWQEKFTYIWHNRIAINLLLLLGLFIVGFTYTHASLHEAFITLIKYKKVFFAILLLPMFRDKQVREYAINAFLYGVIFLLLCSYLRYFNIIHFSEAQGISEVFHNSIDFNFLIGFGVYLLLVKFWQIKSENSQFKWIYLLLIALSLYNILFMTIGRTGYVVSMVLIGLFCFQHLRFKQLVVAMLGVLILCTSVFFFSPAFKIRLNNFNSDIYELRYKHNADTSIGLRLTFLHNGLNLLRQHPWIGTGTGSFYTIYKNNFGTISNFEIKNPHNEYIYIGVQFGLLGILLLMFNFLMQLWYSRKLDVPCKHIAQAVVLSIMVGSLANSLLMNSVQGHLYTYFIALTFSSLYKQNRHVEKQL